MEASRLVFVFVRDSKPRRKVAVPVPDGYSWDQFTQQIKTKLKLSGVGDIYLASSGQIVQSLDDLQDIDELCVVEAPEVVAHSNGIVLSSEAALRGGVATTSEIVPQLSGNLGAINRQQAANAHLEKHKVAVADSVLSSAASPTRDDERKYARRVHPMKRALQRVLPGLFAPSLPVTTRDIPEEKGPLSGRPVRRQRKRTLFSMRNFLMILAVLSCVGTIIFMFVRMSIAMDDAPK